MMEVGERAAPRTAGAAGARAGQSTRERILDIALDLFVRKGYAETSLREIAAELGTSKAALYYHFESKQAILMALHLRLHSLTDDLLPLLESGAPTGDTWERLIDRMIGFALQNRRLIELQLRNREAMAEMHRDSAQLKKHELEVRNEDLEGHVRALLSDPAVPAEWRVRMMASMGAVAGVLLTADVFANVPDADLASALRAVVHDVLGNRSPDGANASASSSDTP